MSKIILFVYGTLKKGQNAHDLLRTSKYYGTAYTAPKYKLYSCGLFPAMKEDQLGNSIFGEIYGIDEITKRRLDIYEGADEGFYNFKKVDLQKIILETYDKLPDSAIYSYIFSGNVEKFKEITFWT